jgi:hypothetical protein
LLSSIRAALDTRRFRVIRRGATRILEASSLLAPLQVVSGRARRADRTCGTYMEPSHQYTGPREGPHDDPRMIGERPMMLGQRGRVGVRLHVSPLQRDGVGRNVAATCCAGRVYPSSSSRSALAS